MNFGEERRCIYGDGALVHSKRSSYVAYDLEGSNWGPYLAYAKLWRKLGIFFQRPPPPEDYVKYIVFNASTCVNRLYLTEHLNKVIIKY